MIVTPFEPISPRIICALQADDVLAWNALHKGFEFLSVLESDAKGLQRGLLPYPSAGCEKNYGPIEYSLNDSVPSLIVRPYATQADCAAAIRNGDVTFGFLNDTTLIAPNQGFDFQGYSKGDKAPYAIIPLRMQKQNAALASRLISIGDEIANRQSTLDILVADGVLKKTGDKHYIVPDQPTP